jgi:hypothetical protein
MLDGTVTDGSSLKILIDRESIKAHIPHRDPFLFVDEVLELERGTRIVAAGNSVRRRSSSGPFRKSDRPWGDNIGSDGSGWRSSL